jgi:hypothetical protein
MSSVWKEEQEEEAEFDLNFGIYKMDGGEKGLADMNHRSSMFFGKTTQDAL